MKNILLEISLKVLIPADTGGLSPSEIIKSHMAGKHGEKDYNVSEEILERWTLGRERRSINVRC